MKKTAPLQTLKSLTENNLISEHTASELTDVIENFSFSITYEMVQQINKTDPNDPVAKQFIPSITEKTILPEELNDPVGDNVHTKVKGVIHRYPDRVLLTPLFICPVYCRFCFRKEKVGSPNETLSPQELEQAFEYIEAHKEIWEVIITGGDPFILKPASLKNIIERLSAIKHVEIIRIHTRVPVVDPSRITDEFMAALKSDKTLYVILHANHANEFSDNAIFACKKMIDAGIPMLSQTVLLKDINDNIDSLSTLMRLLVKLRIKPYYLHHPDLVRGTSHFRISIAEGQKLVKELHGRFSGLCQPTYVLDIPGGHGKVPIGPGYVANLENGCEIEDYLGNKHSF